MNHHQSRYQRTQQGISHDIDGSICAKYGWKTVERNWVGVRKPQLSPDNNTISSHIQVCNYITGDVCHEPSSITIPTHPTMYITFFL